MRRAVIRRLSGGRVGPLFAWDALMLCLEGKREMEAAARKQTS